jgi:hypothetical protein
MDDITASERRGRGEKNGYSFLGPDFSFLIVVVTFEALDLIITADRNDKYSRKRHL